MNLYHVVARVKETASHFPELEQRVAQQPEPQGVSKQQNPRPTSEP